MKSTLRRLVELRFILFLLSLVLLLYLALLLLWPAQPPVTGRDFSLVVLPDPQFYAAKFPAGGLAQTEWVKDNVKKYNIRFVSSVGDNVDLGEAKQWKNSARFMQVLDDAVPFGLADGNHDHYRINSRGERIADSAEFLTHYGPERFQKYNWYGGASDSGFSSWQKFTGDSYRFIIIHLTVCAPQEEVAWARKVIADHPRESVILTTHQFLGPSGKLATGYALPGQGRQTPTEIWNGLIRSTPQIFMVLCGHYSAEAYLTKKNDAGQDVHLLLQDYQDEPNGGDGWLRLLTFRPETSTIDVRTWSPTLKAFKKGPKSQYAISFDFARFADLEKAAPTTSKLAPTSQPGVRP